MLERLLVGGEAAASAAVDGRPPPARATAAPLQSVLMSGSGGVLGSLDTTTGTGDGAAGDTTGDAPPPLPAAARGHFYRLVATLHLDSAPRLWP